MRPLLDKESYKIILNRRRELINHLWFTLLRDAWLHSCHVEKLFNPDLCYVPPEMSRLQIPDTVSQNTLLTYAGFIFNKKGKSNG